jgi:hypothetical protein
MVVMMSLWRNDADRHLQERVDHLLSKTCRLPIRWLWVVGDSSDDTENLLRRMVVDNPQVTIIRRDSGITGDDLATRRRRSSWTASAMFAEIPLEAHAVCLHESDLQSSTDVLTQLLLSSHHPVAGWPIIRLADGPQFYDIWAYRGLNGLPFSPYARPPAHMVRVSSFGSVWMAPTSMVRNRTMGDEAIVSLCAQWTREGIPLWVNPAIVIQQPVDLWEAP